MHKYFWYDIGGSPGEGRSAWIRKKLEKEGRGSKNSHFCRTSFVNGILIICVIIQTLQKDHFNVKLLFFLREQAVGLVISVLNKITYLLTRSTW